MEERHYAPAIEPGAQLERDMEWVKKEILKDLKNFLKIFWFRFGPIGPDFLPLTACRNNKFHSQ